MTNFLGKAGSGDTRGPGPSGRGWLFLWGLLFLGVTPLHGQRTIADYDYENLSFRGFSLEGGHIWPTRADPTYTVDGVTHFAVTNMPGAVPRTASQSLSAAILPYTQRLARGGWEAYEPLKKGVNVRDGDIVHPALKEME